jgi:hypothetical protein
LFPILSQINPINTFSPHFFKTISNIILTFTPRPSERCLPFRFSSQFLLYTSQFPMRATCPAHLILLYLITPIGVLGFDSRRRLGIFFFTNASRTALVPTQSPIQWVQRALSLGVKRPRREADHSPRSSAEVKE